MQSIPRTLADKFTEAFAGKDVAFSARQIADYFSQYSNLVKPFDHYGVNPSSGQYRALRARHCPGTQVVRQKEK